MGDMFGPPWQLKQAGSCLSGHCACHGHSHSEAGVSADQLTSRLSHLVCALIIAWGHLPRYSEYCTNHVVDDDA